MIAFIAISAACAVTWRRAHPAARLALGTAWAATLAAAVMPRNSFVLTLSIATLALAAGTPFLSRLVDPRV